MNQANKIPVHIAGHHHADLVEVGEHETVESLAVLLIAAGKFGDAKVEEIFLFEEDAEEELPRHHKLQHGKRHHAHRCREVWVRFVHVDQEAKHAFRPAATIRKLLKWAKDHFKVDQSGKFELRLDGPDPEPLPLDAHIGSYVVSRDCKITLVFAPSCRIEG
jgi:hypothetical protein